MCIAYVTLGYKSLETPCLKHGKWKILLNKELIVLMSFVSSAHVSGFNFTFNPWGYMTLNAGI